jgi:hypothetical protein
MSGAKLNPVRDNAAPWTVTGSMGDDTPPSDVAPSDAALPGPTPLAMLAATVLVVVAAAAPAGTPVVVVAPAVVDARVVVVVAVPRVVVLVPPLG